MVLLNVLSSSDQVRSISDERAPVSLSGHDLIVVTDLDGTLWDRSESIHPTTWEALHTLHEIGATVMAATGRRRRHAVHSLGRAGIFNWPLVLLDGALGCHPGGLGSWLRRPLYPDDLSEILDTFARVGYEPIFEADDEEYDVVVGDSPSWPRKMLDTLSVCHLASLEFVDVVSVFGAVGLLPLGEAFKVADMINERDFGIARVGTDPEFSEVGVVRVRPRKCSKWEGIRSWLSESELETPVILAVGNDLNDIEMISGADISVAVENAIPEVLAVADHFIAPPEAGGWASLLKLL